MIDWANKRASKQHQAWLFYLALWGPVALWFSYTFVIDLIERHVGVVWIMHLVWVLISIVFCAIWSSSRGLTNKVEGLALFGYLILFSIAQAVLHFVVLYVGCIPVGEAIYG